MAFKRVLNARDIDTGAAEPPAGGSYAPSTEDSEPTIDMALHPTSEYAHPTPPPASAPEPETPVDAFREFPPYGTSIRHLFRSILDHLEALVGVFKLEMRESSARILKKCILFFAALCLSLFAYGLLWAVIIVLLAPLTGWAGSIAIAFAVNAIAATILLKVYNKTQVAPLIPETSNAVKDDFTCLKMSLKK